MGAYVRCGIISKAGGAELLQIPQQDLQAEVDQIEEQIEDNRKRRWMRTILQRFQQQL